MFFLITQLYFILNKHLQEIHLVHNQQLRIITTRLDNLVPKFTAIRTILNKLVPNLVVFSIKYTNVDTYKRIIWRKIKYTLLLQNIIYNVFAFYKSKLKVLKENGM